MKTIVWTIALFGLVMLGAYAEEPVTADAQQQTHQTTPPELPLKFFATNGGRYSAGFGTGIVPGPDTMWVAPFMSPEEGFVFNQMSATIDNYTTAPIKCSFGVYDTQGKAVAHSGHLVLQPGGDPFCEVKVVGRLLSSRVYFTAIAHDKAGNTSVGVRFSLVPDTRFSGKVDNVVVRGMIPDSFDPQKIIPQTEMKVLSITLSLLASGPVPTEGFVLDGSGKVQTVQPAPSNSSRASGR